MTKTAQMPPRSKVILRSARAAGPPQTVPPSAVAHRPVVRDPRGAVPHAHLRNRHLRVVLGFLGMVALPSLLAGVYLYLRAADQYVSTLGFVVRSESAPSGADLLGGMTGLSALSGGSSSDTDILYEYLQSQTLVGAIDDQLDLKKRWGGPHKRDPIFAYNPDGLIEDLHSYWPRMVRVIYDSGSGLITLNVHAFGPQSAQDITRAIERESSRMINDLMEIARGDRISHAQAELTRAEVRLTGARGALTMFRARNNMVDPLQDLQGEIGVIHQLKTQLAEEMIGLDMLRGQQSTAADATQTTGQTRRKTKVTDARIIQGENRVAIIENRIAAERRKFGADADGVGRDYATLTGDYERLAAGRDMAQASHMTALAAYDVVRAEAQRQSRYLAAYTAPTLAQSST
jgi:capsular polysaccharide transport system permease protein